MTDTLLQTKLYAPPLRPNLVPRPRLIDRLNQDLRSGNGFTLVSAPAGFGKTTLLSAWARQADMQMTWLSLDEGDNDLARFLTYLIAALRTIEEDVGRGLQATLKSPGAANVESIFIPLINEIATFLDNVVLILDDYHVIESRPVDEAITFFLEHLPPQMHLVIAGRIDPSLPLSRLRARRQMTEIRADDLRFTPDEVATFMNQVFGFELSNQDVVALGMRTEGWVAGLQLAALSMRGLERSSDVADFVNRFTGSDRYIHDYLTDEVLRQQPSRTRDFLLQTSILKRLSAPLCDAVVKGNDSQTLLESLEASNLFIVPLDNERRWYRYHHLFADLLHGRLRRFHPDRPALLHLRAAGWFEENGLLAEAIDHAFSARDDDLAASLIERTASETMSRGDLATVLRWSDALPDRLLDVHPHLRFYQARALSLSGESRKAEKLALKARSALDRLPDTPENLSLRGELAALLTGIIVYRYDPPGVFREAEEALAFLPENDLNSRARVHIALGTAYAYDDDLQKAAETYRLTRELAFSAGNPFLATAANDMLAELQLYHLGRLKELARSLPRIMERGRTAGGTLQPFTGTAHILLGEINLEWNNLEAASGYLEKGLELLKKGGIGYSLVHLYCAKARLELALCEAGRAAEALHAANRAAQSFPLMHMLIHNMAYHVKSALYLGDVDAAYRWATGEECELPERLPAYLHEMRQTSLARVYLARGDHERSIETLDGIRPQAESAGNVAHVIEIALLKALALQEQGNVTAAVKSLRSSFALAAPEGYVRTYVEAGAPLASLLHEMAAQRIMPEYTGELLSALAAGQREDAAEETGSLLEPLTPRELEVLQLLARGLSNREIGERLFLALDTIKGHNRNIYGKLGVRNRTQAINKAISLKIILPQ